MVTDYVNEVEDLKLSHAQAQNFDVTSGKVAAFNVEGAESDVFVDRIVMRSLPD